MIEIAVGLCSSRPALTSQLPEIDLRFQSREWEGQRSGGGGAGLVPP